MNQIEELSNALLKHDGIAPSNRHYVIFSAPKAASVLARVSNILTPEGFDDLASYKDPRDVAALCIKTTIPGFNFMTQEYRDRRNPRSVVHSMMYNDITMRFIITNDYYAHKYFRSWMNLMMDKVSYRLNYKDEYTRDITITTVNQCNVPTNSYRILNAFPVSISEVELENKSEAELLSVDVTFKYDDYIDNRAEVNYVNEFKKVQEAVRSGDPTKFVNMIPENFSNKFYSKFV